MRLISLREAITILRFGRWLRGFPLATGSSSQWNAILNIFFLEFIDSSVVVFIVYYLYKLRLFAQSSIFITTPIAKPERNILFFDARGAWHCEIMPESRFTLEDVARNNGRANARAWIVIRDVVYDVTDYLDMVLYTISVIYKNYSIVLSDTRLMKSGLYGEGCKVAGRAGSGAKAIREHPGGSELLMEYVGKDGTSGFVDFGHSSDAYKMMSSYRIGQLVESDRVSIDTRKKKIARHSKSKEDSTRHPSRRSFLRIVCGGCV